MDRQKSAEAIVPASRGRAERVAQGTVAKLEDGMGQKHRQLVFDWGEPDESREEPRGESDPSAALAETGALARHLMEAVVSRSNMVRALKRVRSNKGSPGVDGMTVDALLGYLREVWTELRAALLEGSYRPRPVKRVSIPKPGGGVRELGIPTVVDRLIQQALLQVLTPLYDPTFSEHSYGFRPGRSAHDAVKAARQHVSDGHRWVVDLDLEKFFDRVNHDVLMSRLARRIGDKRVLRLIRRYLQAGVMLHGVVQERHEGTPQGGPLSPLLANILLDEFDRELSARGHRFCRYADDCNIYVRSRRAGERVLASLTRFLEQQLRLRVNAKKSGVGYAGKRKFLGFRIYIAKAGAARVTLAPETLKRLKDRVRQITKRSRSVSFGRVAKELATFTNGWLGYYQLGCSAKRLKDLDSWVRHRLRCYIWMQWKRLYTRVRKMLEAGVKRGLAWRSAKASGPWRASNSGAMKRALPNSELAARGFQSLHERYLALTAT